MINHQEVPVLSSNIARAMLNYMSTMAQGSSLAKYLRDRNSHHNFDAMLSSSSKILLIMWVVLICSACGSHSVSHLSPKEWLIYHGKLETKQTDKTRAQPKRNRTIL